MKTGDGTEAPVVVQLRVMVPGPHCAWRRREAVLRDSARRHAGFTHANVCGV